MVLLAGLVMVKPLPYSARWVEAVVTTVAEGVNQRNKTIKPQGLRQQSAYAYDPWGKSM